MPENKEIAVLNDYPPDQYNLLIPVKTMQELSSMEKVIFNQVEISPDYNKNSDVYVQTKGYGDSPDKLALTKIGLAKLMYAAGIEIVYSEAETPSTHQTAIDMAKAIGKVVPYDTRDVAHKVAISIPEPSGQRRVIPGSTEIIYDHLKAEYMEQKKNMMVWENKNGKNVKRPATDEEKEAAVEKQLIQFVSHARAQVETKALNRALREAMVIKSTYTAEELKKPFVVARIIPNLDQPEIKQIMLNKYANGVASLFGATEKSNTKVLQQPKEDIPLIEAGDIEVITPGKANEETDGPPLNENIQDANIIENKICEDCKKPIEAASEEWTIEKIAKFSKDKFGRELCTDCVHKENEKLNEKLGGK